MLNRLSSLAFLLLLAGCFFACQPTSDPAYVSTDHGPGKNPRLLFTNGNLDLSYTAYPYGTDSTPVLFATHYANGRWTTPQFVTEMPAAFVNWADFPSARFEHHPERPALGFHHYLAYSADGTYDYDVHYTFFNDSVRLDNEILHTDGVAAEHGFLSSASLPDGRLQVSWLDGRYTKQVGADAGAQTGSGAKSGHDHGHGGAMTLHTRTLPDVGSTELDARVCDCCNTATVATDSLILVAYRDRSEHEVRDIAYVTRSLPAGEWSVPRLVHADNWVIAGCPVNGPALAANPAGQIAVTWYTAAADHPRTYFARFDPSTNDFAPPLLLADSTPLGRQAIALAPNGTAFVTGLITDPAGETTLTLWTISPDDEVTGRALRSLSPSRASGFPQLVYHRDTLHLAYNVFDLATNETRVETATLPWMP